ncbi:DNA ligase [Rhabdochromatium marinum]|uniref:DNA ligase n=1 Tax=Rhabdochromatium marinum TaxID=48729 RepID=UPI001F5C07B0|nr:DNA ligase [Rhabdochromatium marinum]
MRSHLGLLAFLFIAPTLLCQADDAPPASHTAVPPVTTAAQLPAPPALMLAKSLDPDAELGTEITHYWVSEKLDGVRARWDGSRLISRGGHLIRAPEGFTAGFPKVALDGELWLGRGTFARMSGLARRLEPDAEAWREVRFMVFDLPMRDAPFTQRLNELQRLFSHTTAPHLALIEQFRVANQAELMARLHAVEQAGGEGLMLHHEDALYRIGRSSQLLKVKSVQDAEARVLAHEPGRGKYTGLLGALLVEDDQGRRFRIGTGFSDAERRNPPPIGSTITFQYQGETTTGLPRFARYLRVREPE